MTNQLFDFEFCVVPQHTFYPQKDYEHVISTKIPVFIPLVGSSETGKSQLIYNWLKVGTYQLKFDKTHFFYQTSQPLHNVMQKEKRSLEFVQGVNFQFSDSLKNNDTKYSLLSDDSFEEICNSKAFVDIATTGRHRGLSTIYIKHNLFHPSKLGIDVQLQNTHIVLLKSPRDVMQVTTLGAHLGLGSEIVEYRDATSVPFGHFLIDLWPRTDDRLRCCTNSGSVPSTFFSRTFKSFKASGRRTHKISLLSKCFNCFPASVKATFFSHAQNSLSGFYANAW